MGPCCSEWCVHALTVLDRSCWKWFFFLLHPWIASVQKNKPYRRPRVNACRTMETILVTEISQHKPGFVFVAANYCPVLGNICAFLLRSSHSFCDVQISEITDRQMNERGLLLMQCWDLLWFVLQRYFLCWLLVHSITASLHGVYCSL